MDSEGDIPSEMVNLTRTIFREVWNNFYDWENTYSQGNINSLSQPSSAVRGSCGISRSINSSTDKLITQTLHASQKHSKVQLRTTEVTRWDHRKRSSTASPVRITADVITVLKFSPYLEYESVTPTSRSIFHGDDNDSMAFIPYPEDPTFDFFDHTFEYKTFSWQVGFQDPDIELIVMETALRLKSLHSLSFSDIDKTRVLPLELLSQSGHCGLLQKICWRDIPKSPMLKQLSMFQSRPPTFIDASNLQSRLESIVSNFCPNLSCLQPFCSVHVNTFPMSQPVAPAVQSNNLVKHVKDPCGEYCFMLVDPTIFNHKLWQWSESDIHDLRTVLDLTPDLIPCDLSTICRKPCREVYAQRCLVFADEKVNTRRPRKYAPKFTDFDPNIFTPGDPCSHAGPCDNRSQCACYTNKAHCERNCRCSLKCARRWKGCHCTQGKVDRMCGTEKCPCRKANRECDPDLCVKCQARDAYVNICQNVQLQQCRRKGLEVKESRWGLGTFLTEDAKAHDLIGEYAGELIFELTTESREDLVKYRQRNYVFGLNSTLSIDSSYAGSETRFINHMAKPKANSHPHVSLVNGEHRIGIYALRDMKAGTEVTFDYGPQFFK